MNVVNERRWDQGRVYPFYFRFFNVESFCSPPAGATGAASDFFLSSAVGASVFFVEGDYTRLISTSSQGCKGIGTYLGDGLLLRADEAEEDTEHTEEGDDREGKTNTSLRMSLEREDGVDLGKVEELEDLAANELNGVCSEADGSLLVLLVTERRLIRRTLV